MRATAELRNTATIGSRGLATTPIVLRLGGTANNNSSDNEARRVHTLYKGCGGRFEDGNLPDRFSSAFSLSLHDFHSPVLGHPLARVT